MARAIAEARAAAVAALAERLADAPEGPFARAGLALEGGDEADLARRSPPAAPATPPPAGRWPARTAPISLVTHLGKNQPASLCLDRRAEGAADRPDPRLSPISSPSAPAAARSSCSTRSPPISIRCRRAALFERLGAAGGQVWMTGTEPGLFAGIGAGATWFAVADGAVDGALNSARFSLGFGPRFPISWSWQPPPMTTATAPIPSRC